MLFCAEIAGSDYLEGGPEMCGVSQMNSGSTISAVHKILNGTGFICLKGKFSVHIIQMGLELFVTESKDRRWETDLKSSS